MKNSPWIAIGVEDNCAIQVENDSYRIITSKKNAKAYIIFWKQGKYFKQEIQQSEGFLPLQDLIRK